MGTERGAGRRTGHGYRPAELADVLFASSLQESEDPSPAQVRAAVEEGLSACHGDCSVCAAWVAQEAGDHPEAYVRRMRWALRTIANVYSRTEMRRMYRGGMLRQAG
jgi:hypothetical protein